MAVRKHKVDDIERAETKDEQRKRPNGPGWCIPHQADRIHGLDAR